MTGRSGQPYEHPQGEEQISDGMGGWAGGRDLVPAGFSSILEDIQADPTWFMNEGDPVSFGNAASPGPGALPGSGTGGLDFFGELSSYPEIMMELAKHLPIRQFMSLYSISKDFHAMMNGHLMHIMVRCAEYRAPESAKIYRYHLYSPLCIPDPVGRPKHDGTGEVRQVPGLKWLQMVYHRERVVRDILAFLARQGHRCPKGMSVSVKKMWFVMDIATCKRRSQIMHDETFWTDVDIYNIQFFIVKLEMRFNDPFNGPGEDGLRRLLLGQRGLSPMWRMFRREKLRTPLDLMKMIIRYHYHREQPSQKQLSLFGIPPEEIGIGHKEGWGEGIIHLYRPDELMMREAVRRHLKLSTHLQDMMLWGYVDPVTHENIVPSAEEMYISDDDEEEGGKKWSDVEATEWKDPPLQSTTLAWVKRQEEGGWVDIDGWSTDEDELGDEMNRWGLGDGYEVPSDEDDTMSEGFLASMEIDDQGRLINAPPEGTGP